MKLFIACSARDKIPQKYFDGCEKLLSALLKENDLVFGACTTGLMGVAHKIALKNGREIIAATPKAYAYEAENTKCSQKIITDTVGERTEKALALSDGAIFLPGGIGTVYELFSAIESKRCKEFLKPIVIFNLDGYYDELLSFLEKIYAESFAKVLDKNNYFIAKTVEEVLNFLKD